ncbi:MAG TPA: hypothetical protein VIZ17_23210 [Acetobacteraceae bacterium]
MPDVLCDRWPDVVLKDLAQEGPAWAMTANVAADLGWCRRDVEPLRIVIMPQHDWQIAMPAVAPKPVLV